MTALEIVATSGSIIVTVSLVLAWLLLSSQESISRDAHIVRWVAVRAAITSGVLFVTCWKSIGLTIWASCAVVAAVPLITMLLPVLASAIDTSFAGLILLPILLPCFAMAVVVLGPAIFETLYPRPEPEAKSAPPALPPGPGAVVATLRPIGDIEINGERLTAKSVSGGMVAVGTEVSVIAREGNVLLVQPLIAETTGGDG